MSRATATEVVADAANARIAFESALDAAAGERARELLREAWQAEYTHRVEQGEPIDVLDDMLIPDRETIWEVGDE